MSNLDIEAIKVLNTVFQYEVKVCIGTVDPRKIYVSEPYTSYNYNKDIQDKIDKRNERIKGINPVLYDWLTSMKISKGATIDSIIPKKVWSVLFEQYPDIYNKNTKNSIYMFVEVLFGSDFAKEVKNVIRFEVNTVCNTLYEDKGTKVYNLANIDEDMKELLSILEEGKKEILLIRYNMLNGDKIRSYKEVGEWYGVSGIEAKKMLQEALTKARHQLKRKGFTKRIVRRI